jgi:hypothetical protein
LIALFHGILKKAVSGLGDAKKCGKAFFSEENQG